MSDRVDILALGAACIVPALGLLWKAASLRKDMVDKWAVRVDIVSAGLAENSSKALRRLRAAIDKILGGPGEEFDPARAVADPGKLQKQIREFDQFINARRRISSRFRSMLRLCGAAPVTVVIYLIGAGAALSYYAGFHQVRWVGLSGLICAGVGIGLGAIVTVMYWYISSRLTAAELLALPADHDSDKPA